MTNEPSEASSQQQPEPNAAASEPNSHAHNAEEQAAVEPQSPVTPRPETQPDALPDGSDAALANESASSAQRESTDLESAEMGQLPGASTAPPASDKIQIGSRRNRSEQEPSSSKPKIAKPAEPMKVENDPTPSGPVPTPSVRDPLTPDLEKQFDAAMGDI